MWACSRKIRKAPFSQSLFFLGGGLLQRVGEGDHRLVLLRPRFWPLGSLSSFWARKPGEKPGGSAASKPSITHPALLPPPEDPREGWGKTT